MKYSLSSRQPDSVLNRAEEIRVIWNDRNLIKDLLIKFPDKEIVLLVEKNSIIEEQEWQLFKEYANIFKEFHLSCEKLSINIIENCQKFNIKYFWSFPATSFFELNSLINNGVSQILIGIPLIFDLESVVKQTKNISLRAIPNYAYEKYLSHSNGLHGQYIRPEDVDLYEQYISYLEFRIDEKNFLEKESTLLHIYKDNKKWPGDLGLIITNLDVKFDNRAVPEEFGKIRMNCRHNCERLGTCHFCDTSLHFIKSLIQKRDSSNTSKAI